jgi:uncharacterized protein YjiS (DUF1127 family)
MSITIDHMTGARMPPRAGPPQTNSWYAVSAGWQLVRRWAERRGQRRALAELARLPHLLDDVGLTRAQALREAAKPFWRR